MRENMIINKICKYHLECVLKDGENRITEHLSNLDNTFLLLNEIPLYKAMKFDYSILNSPTNKFKNISYKIGYPTLFKTERSRNGRFVKRIQPIFLFNLDTSSIKKGQLHINDKYPEINHDFLKSVLGNSSKEVTKFIKELYEELNINSGTNNEELTKIVNTLLIKYPDWNWIGKFDSRATTSFDKNDIFESGIHNCGFLFETEQSRYTQGLEYELLQLSQMDGSDFVDTQLSHWAFDRSRKADSQDPNIQIIEPLPVNQEQRDATMSALTNPLTIITGPPGTGKSQVVTNIIVNAVYNRQTVLLSSKNHKAVDVVIDKVNEHSQTEYLLNLGGSDSENNMMSYLTSLLFSSNIDPYLEKHNFYKRELADIQASISKINAKINDLITLRNDVSNLEEDIESFKDKYPKLTTMLINHSKEENLDFQKEINYIITTINGSNIFAKSFFIRLCGMLFKRKSHENFSLKTDTLNKIYKQFGFKQIDITLNEFNKQNVKNIIEEIFQFQTRINKLITYINTLKELQTHNIDMCILKNYNYLKKSVNVSNMLWINWIKLRRNSINNEDRVMIGELITILNMIKQGKNDIPKDVWRKYYSLMNRVVKQIPCCAITLLSVKNKIPLEPNIFDIVVIDEASQCDIASLIPILYRAKKAVIIGDPKQLSHITSINVKMNVSLLTQNDLNDKYSNWSYMNSAFHLSNSIKNKTTFKLDEHYRSHPDIINFANKTYYDQDLIILTNDTLNFSESRVFFTDIVGETVRLIAGSYVNNNEAEKTIQLLKRIVTKRVHFSIGVVTPFRAQANLIRQKIYSDTELSDELMKRAFICDTVHKFQGDEKDVIIYNSVISKKHTESMIHFLAKNPELFNVAITRARSYFIFIGDKQACLSSKISYYKDYIEYVAMISNTTDIPPKPISVFESKWEKILYDKLKEEGYSPIPQYSIINYRLDFALLIGDRKINIEVDGEMYHKNWDGRRLKSDLIRDKRLIDLGWEVLRFWVYEIKDDMDRCLEKVRTCVENEPQNYII